MISLYNITPPNFFSFLFPRLTLKTFDPAEHNLEKSKNMLQVVTPSFNFLLTHQRDWITQFDVFGGWIWTGAMFMVL